MKKCKKVSEIKDASKRRFLKDCGLALVATASYEVIAIMGAPGRASAKTCEGRCEDLCVDCTGCTTAPCFEAPDPGDPEPVPDPEPGGTTDTPDPAPGGTGEPDPGDTTKK